MKRISSEEFHSLVNTNPTGADVEEVALFRHKQLLGCVILIDGVCGWVLLARHESCGEYHAFVCSTASSTHKAIRELRQVCRRFEHIETFSKVDLAAVDLGITREQAERLACSTISWGN